MIASKDYVLKMLAEESLFPKKKYSQNFLINENIAKKIVDLLQINSNDKVIEIGAGLGALSELIVNSTVLKCYEIDERMCEHLKKTFMHNQRFSLVEGDFLKQEIIVEKCKVISNLPYALTTPIIEKVILEIKECSIFVFMTQKEVIERLMAKVSSKEYSPLAIILNHIGVLKKSFDVQKNNFFPIPNVDSSVFILEFKENRDLEFDNKFYKFLKCAFSMRRKTLVNNLIKSYPKERISDVLKMLQIPLTIRPEELTYELYLKIFKEITTQK